MLKNVLSAITVIALAVQFSAVSVAEGKDEVSYIINDTYDNGIDYGWTVDSGSSENVIIDIDGNKDGVYKRISGTHYISMPAPEASGYVSSITRKLPYEVDLKDKKTVIELDIRPDALYNMKLAFNYNVPKSDIGHTSEELRSYRLLEFSNSFSVATGRNKDNALNMTTAFYNKRFEKFTYQDLFKIKIVFYKNEVHYYVTYDGIEYTRDNWGADLRTRPQGDYSDDTDDDTVADMLKSFTISSEGSSGVQCWLDNLRVYQYKDYVDGVEVTDNSIFIKKDTTAAFSARIRNISGMKRNITAAIAEYDENGYLVDVAAKSTDINNCDVGGVDVKNEIAEGNSCSAFIWESDSMKPISAKSTPTEIESDVTKIYVSKDGAKAADGSFEKPYGSIISARDKIRSLKRSGKLGANGAIVYIRGSDYYNPDCVSLSSEDSGNENAPIIYKSYPNEKVNLIGGVSLDMNDFIPADEEEKKKLISYEAAEKLMKIDLSKLGVNISNQPVWRGTYSYYPNMTNITGKYSTDDFQPELIINGECMTIARYPNKGNASVSEIIKPGQFGETDSAYIPVSFKVDYSESIKWNNAKYALVHGKFSHSWLDQTLPLDSVYKDGTVNLKYPAYYPATSDAQFYIYNLIEELDSPGEYYIDADKNVLYLYPPNENVNSIFLATKSDSYFSLYATKYVTIDGLNMNGGRKNAVTIYNGSNNAMQNCSVRNMQSVGIGISGNKNGVDSCSVSDCNGGITIANGDESMNLEARKNIDCAENYIINSELYDNDRISKTYSPSVKLMGCGHIVRNNRIHGAEHDIIEFAGNEHTIEYNEIYDAVVSSNDAGAIYSNYSMSYKGNVIRYNYFHDIGTYSNGEFTTQAIYLDDFMSSATVFGNVFSNIKGYGVNVCGSDNIIENNIFVDCENSVYAKRDFWWDASGNTYAQATEGLIKSLEEVPYNGDIWKSAYPEMTDYLGKDENGKTKPKVGYNIGILKNILYNAGEISVSKGIAEKTQRIYDNIIYEYNPGFADYGNGDYSLKNSSQVFKDIDGFENIPFSQIGLKK